MKITICLLFVVALSLVDSNRIKKTVEQKTEKKQFAVPKADNVIAFHGVNFLVTYKRIFLDHQRWFQNYQAVIMLTVQLLKLLL